MNERIVVCICTRGRPKLFSECLASVKRAYIPDGYDVSILVIDNNDEASSEVQTACEEAWPDVYYDHEARAGLSLARNCALRGARGLNADWIAFIDDDERADAVWLVEFMTAIEKHSQVTRWECSYCGKPHAWPVDAAHGVIEYEFPSDAPAWRCRDPWGKWGDVDGKHLNCAGTGNVIFRASKARGLCFDEAQNTSGGEDTKFFQRFHHERGGRIVLSLYATVTETVTWDRITLQGHAKKAFRNGVHKIELSHMKRSKAIKQTVKRTLTGLWLLAMTPLAFVAGKDRALKIMLTGVLKLSEAAGTAAAVCGRSFNYYAKTTGQ